MRYAFAALVVYGAALAGCSDAGPATITLTGRIVDGLGYPITDAIVQVNTLAPVSATGGTFSVTGVVPPYDVTFVRPSVKYGMLFQGLTRPDPVLQYPFVGQFDDKTAVVRGKLSGGVGFPVPGNYRTDVIATVAQAGYYGVVNDAGDYTIGRHWQNAASITTNIRVLQWRVDGSTGLPLSYAGYGSLTGLSLMAGADLSGQDIVLAPVSSATFSGSVNVPNGLTMGFRTLYLTLPDGKEAFGLGRDTLVPASFSYVTPDIPGGRIALGGAAWNNADTYCYGWRTNLPPAASGLTLSLPAPPVVTGPTPGATGVTKSTIFSWTGQGVHRVAFDGLNGAPSFAVVTTKTVASMPDVSALGLSVPASAQYQWTLYEYSTKTMDEATGSTGYISGLEFPTVDASNCTVGPRRFTTGPQ